MFSDIFSYLRNINSEVWLLLGFSIVIIYGIKSYAYEKVFNNIGVVEYLGWVPIYRWFILCQYLVPGTKVRFYSILPITAWIFMIIPIIGWGALAYMRGTVLFATHNEVLRKSYNNTFLLFLFGFIPATWFLVALIKYKKLPIE